jgi:ubiquinone/menaquinone biosynthesis C-methylase UbiE
VSAAAFDAIASRYDATWTTTSIGRAQRAQVWRHIDRLFCPDESVLDIGCGTGEDAAHLTARGLTVHAIDPSPEMVRIAAGRGGFRAEVLGAEDLERLSGPYDGALSNFGALNCVEDLAAVNAGLAKTVRSGGRVALCTIGRFCLWEVIHYALRGQFRKAMRRRHGNVLSSLGLRIYYRSVSEILDAFPQFRLEGWTGIGLLVPPSYVTLPAPLVSALGALDHLLAGLPLLRGMADHRLLILVRK